MTESTVERNSVWPEDPALRRCHPVFVPLVIVTWGVFVACNGVFGNEHTRSMRNAIQPEAICGPKCVAYILDFYHRPWSNDVLELARAMQWPESNSGVSLGEVAQTLREHGIYCKKLELSDTAQLVWKYPVIVHWRPRGFHSTSERPVGHFVVWLPESKDDAVRYYDGAFGVREINRPGWHRRRSGVVLLTSPVPIHENARVAKYAGLSSDGTFARRVGALVLATGIVSAVLSLLSLRPSEKERCHASD